MSGASLLSQKAVSASPARNGVAGSCGSADQVGPTFFNSPVKERLSAFSAFSSPLRNRLRAPLQSAFASPQRPSPVGGGETCAETVINVFFQKVTLILLFCASLSLYVYIVYHCVGIASSSVSTFKG
jgi:hypothetical protein